MAELILAVVALGVSGPGIAFSFAEYGRYIKSKIDSFRQAPAIAIRVGTFGHELHSGMLKESLALADWAYAQHDIDNGLKSVLEDQVDRLRQALIEIDKQLDRCFDEKGNIRRTKFMYSGERNIKASMNALDQWQRSFWGTISLIEMKKRVLPDPLLLTADKFKLSIQADGKFYRCLTPDSHIRLGKAQLLDGTLRHVEVLIEQKRKMTTSAVEIKEIATCLSRNSARPLASRGILRCLGYREAPKLELIFELPPDSGQLQTLERLIEDDMGSAYAGRRPLDYRFRLAHQLSEAVLSVHASNRVHKNVRPDTILMISHNTDGWTALEDFDFGSPYLTDWTMLRQIGSPSSMVGEDDWLTDIFRHPKRQGLQPEDYYNMGHDIYSLGVCLLVIGLWQPLISTIDGIKIPSQKYLDAALRLKLVTAEAIHILFETQSEHRPANTRPVLRSLMRPLSVQKTLQDLAEYELPARMGLAFTRIVISCLSCLEGGLGDSKVFEESNKQAIGIQFATNILQPLSVSLTPVGT